MEKQFHPDWMYHAYCGGKGPIPLFLFLSAPAFLLWFALCPLFRSFSALDLSVAGSGGAFAFPLPFCPLFTPAEPPRSPPLSCPYPPLPLIGPSLKNPRLPGLLSGVLHRVCSVLAAWSCSPSSPSSSSSSSSSSSLSLDCSAGFPRIRGIVKGLITKSDLEEN